VATQSPSPWHQLPPAVQRRNIRWAIAGITGFISIIVVFLLLNGWLQFLGQSSAAVLSFLPCIAFFMLVWFTTHRSDAKLLDRLNASGDQLCPECLYDLSSSDDAHACPECGTAYTQETLNNSWSAYRLTKHGPSRGML
jgi:hypothetical protein